MNLHISAYTQGRLNFIRKVARLHCFTAESIDVINSNAARTRDAGGCESDLSISNWMTILRSGNRALPACASVEFG